MRCPNTTFLTKALIFLSFGTSFRMDIRNSWLFVSCTNIVTSVPFRLYEPVYFGLTICVVLILFAPDRSFSGENLACTPLPVP